MSRSGRELDGALVSFSESGMTLATAATLEPITPIFGFSVGTIMRLATSVSRPTGSPVSKSDSIAAATASVETGRS
ncbi:hypothetical protein D3C86_2215910 [compost metagenome]